MIRLDVDSRPDFVLAEAVGGRIVDQGGNSLVVVDTQSVAFDGSGADLIVAALVEARCVGGNALPPGASVAFLDVETTGLSAGAGTLVFLIGVARLRDGAIETRQCFLHEPAVEAALLGLVAELLSESDALITFNGRCFDVPLLVGRFDLHQMNDPIPSRHVDLLHLARRIWGRRLRQSNLTNLEARVLGRARVSDLPGSEAPGRYFAFLHDRRPEGIIPVLAHNRQDLLSMVELAVRIGQMLVDARGAIDAGPSDLLGLGSLFEDAGGGDSARWCYEAALVGASVSERAEALFRLARLCQRRREIDQAIQLLAAVAEFNVDRAVPAAIELAKMLEHQKRNPALALHYARRAMTLLQARPSPATNRYGPDVAHRINRLERITGLNKKSELARTDRGPLCDFPPPRR